jgi:hypothetical protein
LIVERGGARFAVLESVPDLLNFLHNGSASGSSWSGALTLGQIAAASALGEFETMRVVYRLLVAGLVVLE